MLKTHKRLLCILLIILVGVVSWLVFSTYSKKWLEGEINVLIADLRDKGATIAYSSFDITMTPLAVQATLHNPHLKDSKGLVDWQGQAMRVFMRPWERWTLHFDFLGDQKISLPHNQFLSLDILRLEGAKGILHLTSRGHPESARFTIGRLSSFLDGRMQSFALQDTALEVSNMREPLKLKLSLSTHVTDSDKLMNTPSRPLSISFIAEFSGFSAQRPSPKSLTEWRDGGGVLDVHLLKIDWPPFLTEVEGTVTLDEGMYPLGSFSSRMTGYGEAMNQMVAFGWVKKKKATVALFMLDLLSSPNESGEKQLKIPITLQNKVLSIGPAPLLKLQPLREK